MMFFETTDHVRLNYDRAGTGQPVIFIAGYSGIQESWVAQKQALLTRNYQVITYDRRNHGSSERTKKGRRISRHGMDLAELMAHLELENVDLVGHSMGAGVVWAYLSLFSDDNVRHIVTVDESPKTITDTDWPYGLLDLTWENFATGCRRIERLKMTHLPIATEIKRTIGKAYQPFDFDLNLPLLIDHTAQDWRDVVMNLQRPQLFLAGGCSPLWSAEHAPFSAKLNPEHAQAYTFSHAGHLPHIECPDDFNQVLLNFLDDKQT
jgi:pimeloyl-ACP methyl ester carboxylesterase